MEFCYNLVHSLTTSTEPAKGYLYYLLLKAHVEAETAGKEAGTAKTEEGKEDEKEVEEFKLHEQVEPYMMKFGKEYQVTTCASFNEGLDTFFTAKEKEKERARQLARETAIWKKMERIKENQESRIRALQGEQEESEQKARLIDMHVEEINAIIQIINTMVEAGLKWADIWKNIKDEKKRGNAFANMISKIDLLNNCITVMLNATEEDDCHEAPTQLVDIDISLNAHQNSKVSLFPLPNLELL
jgi:predicted ribosome quality control (RQC) complex YloA/Tae2 family protein